MNFLSFQVVTSINWIFSVAKRVSWFPPPNIWNLCGYSVGQWTGECERWFQDHVKSIHSGRFQPLSSKAWRSLLRNTRMAGKVMHHMKMGAADFITANKQHFDSLISS
jgi:hypothetical protein